jgi:hypothetical protein
MPPRAESPNVRGLAPGRHHAQGLDATDRPGAIVPAWFAMCDDPIEPTTRAGWCTASTSAWTPALLRLPSVACGLLPSIDLLRMTMLRRRRGGQPAWAEQGLSAGRIDGRRGNAADSRPARDRGKRSRIGRSRRGRTKSARSSAPLRKAGGPLCPDYRGLRRGTPAWRRVADGPRGPPLVGSRPFSPPNIYVLMVSSRSPSPEVRGPMARMPCRDGHRLDLAPAGAAMTRRSRRRGPPPVRSATRGSG